MIFFEPWHDLRRQNPAGDLRARLSYATPPSDHIPLGALCVWSARNPGSILRQNVNLAKLFLNLLDALGAERVRMTVLPARYGPPAVFTRYDRNGNPRSTIVKRPQLFRKNPNQISVRNLAHYFELRSTVAISREQASFRSTPAFLSASARSDPGGRFCASSSALSAAILDSDFIGRLRQSLVPIATASFLQISGSI
jgi:hypothetical protein